MCHFLHADDYGREAGSLNIKAEQMTDEVWNYIFCRRELGDDVLASGIPKSSLETMRRSFSYEYPLTLRSSGKDLMFVSVPDSINGFWLTTGAATTI